jgi:hypothetical protein
MKAMTRLTAALLLAAGPGAAGSAQRDRGDRIVARREARFDRRH